MRRRVAKSLMIAACSTAGLTATGLAAPLPRNVVTDPIDIGELEVVVAPFASFPDTSFGTAPRLNSMTTMGGDLYVVEERDGRIYKLNTAGGPPQLYFDVAAAIAASTDRQLDTTTTVHGGLRSVAFHPSFATNGLLYVSAMESRPADPAQHDYISDATEPIGADSVVIEFSADAGTGIVDPLSYREVFRIGMPVYDHPIRQITFNPFAEPDEDDFGLLYIAHGDGSVQSAIAGGGRNNDGLGKILRIDPRQNGSASYRVPASNPFVADPTMPNEVFSLGHRNPHTLAFGRHGGEIILLSAEPGRDNVEEINLIEAGRDYGWPEREGTFVHLPGGGVDTGVAPLPANEASLGFTYPVAQYGHPGPPGSFFNGAAVAGGYPIDNGSELSGRYFFSDFPKSSALYHAAVDDLVNAVTRLDPADPARDEPVELSRGQIATARIVFDHDADPATAPLPRDSLLDVFDDAPTYETDRADVRFGQGPSGELYVMSKRNNTLYLVTNSVPPEAPSIRVGPIADARSIDEILAATDYLPSDAEILRLYRAFFDREPDLQGAKFWLAEARNGRSVDNIARFFASSDEFGLTFGPVDDSEFLVIVYRNVLDRGIDQPGFEFWLDQMANGMLRHRVVVLFAFSPEFIGLYPYAPITP